MGCASHKYTRRVRRRVLKWIKWGVGSLAIIFLGMFVAIGPGVSWQLLTHGPTTVWDHLEYPTRELQPSPNPLEWPEAPDTGLASLPVTAGLEEAISEGDTLAFLVIHDGMVMAEWYRSDHGADTPSMLFSASKSILSLLIGAAIDDGYIASVDTAVTEYVPELAAGGFESVTIRDLLRMDSSMDYIEDDNPLGPHVRFNYTTDLRSEILDLAVRSAPDSEFRYKSGDNALLGLILERALDGPTVTAYLEERLWNPLGSMTAASWNVDVEGGFERTWCCLAMTARDLARFGQLVLDDGVWQGGRLLSREWLVRSFEPGFSAERWPDYFSDSAVANYGYQWWLLADGSPLALGKAGQYLYIDPVHDVVIVRLGEDQGDVSWARLMQEVSAGFDE